jgi:hypothetical protein
MNDDIVTRLRKLELTLMCNGADGHGFLIKHAADEIERLREWNTEVTKLLQQAQKCMDIWQKSEDELIDFHHGKCSEQFVEQGKEIERLRKERDRWAKWGEHVFICTNKGINPCRDCVSPATADAIRRVDEGGSW